jgi:hypothetical protein
LRIEERGGRDRAQRRHAGIIDPQLACRPRRHFQRADLERGHGRRAGVGLAARARAADDIAARALGDAQRLYPERREKLTLGARHHRNGTHYSIPGWREREEAEPRRRFFENGQIAHAAPVILEEIARVHAGKGEAGLRRR